MNRAKARLKAMLEEYGQVLSLLAFTGTKVQILTARGGQPEEYGQVLTLLACAGANVHILTGASGAGAA